MLFKNLSDNIGVSEFLKTLFYWVATPILLGFAMIAMSESANTYHVGGDYPPNYLGMMALFFFAYVCFGLAIASFCVIFIRFIIEIILPIFGRAISKEHTNIIILICIPVIIFVLRICFYWYLSN